MGYSELASVQRGVLEARALTKLSSIIKLLSNNCTVLILFVKSPRSVNERYESSSIVMLFLSIKIYQCGQNLYHALTEK